MKIVQSFWSSPSKTNDEDSGFARNNGGWLSEKTHAMSWALSCLKFKQFYSEVELFTDSAGLCWLIDKLGLPYTKVVNSLDNFGTNNPSLWSLGKLDTLKRQKLPFLHADGDIYLWEPFPKDFLKNSLFTQNVEFNTINNPDGNIYIDTVSKLEENNAIIPDFLSTSIKKFKQTGRIDAFNMGIVGGDNIDFLKEYAKGVFEFLDANKNIQFIGKDMNFVEQFIFHSLAKHNNLKVNVLRQEENAVANDAYFSMTQFNLVPIIRTFVHVVGAGKKNITLNAQVELRLKYEFPAIYHHIASIYKEMPKNYFIPSENSQNDADPTIFFSSTLVLLNQLGIEYSNCASDEFFNAVEDVLIKNDSHGELRKLSDIYRLEKFIYNKRLIQGKEDENKIKPHEKILELLYKLTPNQFLKREFKLNSDLIEIIPMNFKFPDKIPINDLKDNSLLNKINLASDDLLLLRLSENDTIETEVLTAFDIFLAFFEDVPRSGYELISFIKNEKRNISLDDNQLTVSILSFLTKYSLYHRYLFPSN